MSEESDRVLTALYSEIKNLESASDREEAVALAVDLREAANLILSRASAREEARRKKIEWETILPQCRAAKDHFEQLNAELKKANEIYLETYHQAGQAESRWNQVRDAKPAPYPTPEEIREWENLCKELADSLEAARANCRAANQRRGELTAQTLHARNEFSNLRNRERNMRPPESSPYRGSELAGVR